jgi:thiosulfate/3-mercaptopyruvate sulfurtransferase
MKRAAHRGADTEEGRGMKGYAHPETLVDTAWLEERLGRPGVQVVEVDVDTKAYDQGHVPGAVGWNWQTQLCDPVVRDVIPKPALERLLAESGIGNDTTIVLYGDNNNWFACWAFWQLTMYGHRDVRLLDGGRKKWLAEGRPLTTESTLVTPATYRAADPDFSLRAFLPEVRERHAAPGWALVDVRSPDEYSGKLLAPPGLPETCQRGGHVPGARSIPWGKNCREDGTFASAEELARLYGAAGVTADKSVITYCRIGERSSLSWFALKYLLGYPRVVNYDGSWTEWGNLVSAPVARGDQP